MKEYKIIKRAMKIAAKRYFKRGSRHINYKSEFDYFTDNDMACEKYLISIIKKYFPGDNILSEETSNKTELKNRTWVIDPIDGTHNYANGYDMCGIQVAFYDEGETKLGLIYLPFKKEFYYAIKGKGTFLNNKKIETKKNIKLKESLVIASSLHHDPVIKDIRLNCLNNIFQNILNVRMLGSACQEFADVLLGRAGGFFSVDKKLTQWDFMPASIMCRENGLPYIDKWYKGFEYFITANNEEIASFIEKAIIKSIDEVLDKTAR